MNQRPQSPTNIVEGFVDQVRKYLSLIDTIAGRPLREFLLECAVVLPSLYALGVQLPDVDLPDDDPFEGIGPAGESPMGSIMRLPAGHDSFDPFSIGEAIRATEGKGPAVESPMGSIMNVLAGHDVYREVFDPFSGEEAITATLSNDLDEIYTDLNRPLLKYDTGEEPNQRIAVWEWKFNLKIHWGHHLVAALHPIHCLMHHLDPEFFDSESDD